ncbi:hypothetical protein MRX96_019112 [Rhipicephalus microplus]
MRGQWSRALLLLLLVQPSLQGKLLKAALAAATSGGFWLQPMFLPIPVEETLYYPVHYFLPTPSAAAPIQLEHLSLLALVDTENQENQQQGDPGAPPARTAKLHG